jgi:phosphopantetheinyl transferase (holo-ACP synthase)
MYGARFVKRGKYHMDRQEGVIYIDRIKHWIVRVNNKTLAKFINEDEAIKFYNQKLSADTSTSIA